MRVARGFSTLLLSVALGPPVALAQAPAGTEFRVNTFRTGQQYAPAAAFDRTGNFVVAWSADRGSAAGIDVMAQRYAVGGVPIGGEFIVNTATAGDQYANLSGTPIAMRPDGRFVVVWSHSPAPGTGEVRGQRFEADGSKVGAEFVVDGGASHDYYANVAVGPGGAFAVTWAHLPNPFPAWSAGDVYARVFDAAATPTGPPFLVRGQTSGSDTTPRIAMDAAGNFVVAWRSDTGFAPGLGEVSAQRLSPSGQRVGAVFQVNTYTTGSQYVYSVAAAPDGRFVVVWDSPGDGDGFGVFARRYAADATPMGAEFQVNSATTGKQTHASAAVDDSFRVTVSWQSTTADSRGFGLRGRSFDEQGTPVGAEFLVNSYTTYSQMAANVALDDVGNALVAWHSDRGPETAPNGPSFDLEVSAQRYGGLHPRSLRADGTGNGVLEPGEVAALQPTWTNVTSGAQVFSTDLANPEGPPGGIPQILSPLATYTAPLGASVECATCPTVLLPNPAPRPALHWDGAATESVVTGGHTQRKRWVLHVGASFPDVPPANGFYRFVETLLHHGVTGGCTASAYCPAGLTSREQMAVFVLAAKEGPGYAPPACTTPMFTDVPASSPFCRWIEELSRRGVVAGCGGGLYCPSGPVSREQMAVFVLRTAEPTRTPPTCAPPNTFADVPETSPFCRWIEELALRGVVGGCGGGNYCPLAAVTRDTMAVFISGTFGLALYGP